MVGAAGVISIARGEGGQPGVRGCVAGFQHDDPPIAVDRRRIGAAGGEHIATFEPGIGVVRRGLDRGIAVQHGIAQPALRAQQRGDVDERGWIVGHQPQRRLEQFEGSRHVALFDAGPRARVQGSDIGRFRRGHPNATKPCRAQ